MLNAGKILPKETPLIFLWMVKDSEKLKDNNPIPNHERLPYIDRLYKWADDQPQRTIKLYYVPFDSNGIDLNEEQIQKFHDLASPGKNGRKNIEVINLYSSFKDKYDLSFLKDQDINFACKVDLARIIALIEDGPAIYFDFDVVPSEGSKLSDIPINKHGFAMARTPRRPELENSIIAVDSKNNYILRALYDAIDATGLSNNYDLVWKRQIHAIKQVHTAEKKGVTLRENMLSYLLKDYLLNGEQIIEDLNLKQGETDNSDRREELEVIRKSYDDKYYSMRMIRNDNDNLGNNFVFRSRVNIGKENSWGFTDLSSKEAMHTRDEGKCKEEGLDSCIKKIDKPDNKLNSLAAMAAYKIINKPTRS